MTIYLPKGAEKRDVTRMHNEEGSFRRLGCELEQIAKEYGRDIDEINQMFIEVNGSKQ